MKSSSPSSAAKTGSRHTHARDAVKRAKADAYRRVISDAAQKVFAEHGFDAAKIQDIAQGAGLSLGTLYTVFPGKAEIYSAIQREHGQAVLLEISSSVARVHGELEAALAGIDAYVRCLVARPHYLRMLLREGLSWTQRSWLRTSEEIVTWERGMTLAVSLLRAGIERGFFYADNPPDVLLKMIIAAQQVQLADWLERGAASHEVEGLILRMQTHFRRAFVQMPEEARVSDHARVRQLSAH
jgi:AcrR family transcriptional regulator